MWWKLIFCSCQAHSRLAGDIFHKIIQGRRLCLSLGPCYFYSALCEYNMCMAGPLASKKPWPENVNTSGVHILVTCQPHLTGRKAGKSSSHLKKSKWFLVNNSNPYHSQRLGGEFYNVLLCFTLSLALLRYLHPLVPASAILMQLAWPLGTCHSDQPQTEVGSILQSLLHAHFSHHRTLLPLSTGRLCLPQNSTGFEELVGTISSSPLPNIHLTDHPMLGEGPSQGGVISEK